MKATKNRISDDFIHKSPRANGGNGFTLIETLIAVLILTVAVLGMVPLFTYAIHYNNGGEARGKALAVAQRELEALQSVPFTDSSLNETSQGGVSNTVESFTIVTKIENTIVDPVNGQARLKTITIKVTPPATTKWGGATVAVVKQRASTTLGPY